MRLGHQTSAKCPSYAPGSYSIVSHEATSRVNIVNQRMDVPHCGRRVLQIVRGGVMRLVDRHLSGTGDAARIRQI